MSFTKFDVGLINMSANIVRIFYLELVPLQNLVAPFEGYRIGHAETAVMRPVHSIIGQGWRPKRSQEIQTEKLPKNAVIGKPFRNISGRRQPAYSYDKSEIEDES